MRFVVSSSALYSHLSAASRVMSSKNSMPILDCFLLNIRDGKATITASDSEKYFVTSVELIEMSENAMFCIPAKTLMESIKELAEQPLTLEFNPESCELIGIHQSGSFSVVGQNADPFPIQQDINADATRFTVPVNVLLNGISRCLFATANDEIRLVMTGVYCDIKNDSITFAGTDGRKLVRNCNTSIQPGFEGGFILPKKVCTILKSVLVKGENEVVINFDSEKALIQTAEFELYFRLVEGRYPNYNAVIPGNNPFQATVDRSSLISALKRVGVFCNQSSGLMKVHLENNLMKLTGQDNDYATSAEENIFCEYTNSPISIGFSCQFMLEIASILDGDNLTLQLADPSRPGIVVPAEQDPQDEVLMLLMPMMLND